MRNYARFSQVSGRGLNGICRGAEGLPVILSNGLGGCRDQGPWRWFKQAGSLASFSFSSLHGNSSSSLLGVDLTPSARLASLQGSLPPSAAVPVHGALAPMQLLPPSPSAPSISGNLANEDVEPDKPSKSLKG